MKKSFLFPHWCQKTGWWMLFCWIIWIGLVLSMRLFHISFTTYPMLAKIGLIIYSFLPTIATFMICLSKEKNEDEYIEYIRARSVFFMVVLFFSALLLNVSITNVGLRLCGWTPSKGYLMFSWLYTNPFIITLIYIVIFKGSLFFNWLKTRNDDGQ